MKSKGVLTIAHGHPRFARQAVNLARSIRLHDPDLPLAVATDLDASWFEGMYDQVIPWDFSRHSGLISKLDAYEISPFDVTLLLDTDILMFASLQHYFDYFEGEAFGLIGQNVAESVYFESMDLIREHIPAATYAIFVGGLYYFVKSELACGIFRRAEELLPLYGDLGIRMLRGAINEEPLFALAMAEAGLLAKRPRTADMILNPTGAGGELVDVDVVAGSCWQIDGGGRTRRAMLHFHAGEVHGYGYIRQVLRLQAAYYDTARRVRFEGLIRMQAAIAWTAAPPRGLGKWRTRIEKRIRSLLPRGRMQ